MKKYVFKPYNPSFPALFACEKMRILKAISESLMIEHVGSTAVPGLGGKGIVDIAIAVNISDFPAISSKLQSLGYEFQESGSVPERWFFIVDLPDQEESIRRYHVHLTSFESIEWNGLIAFREYLKSHPETAEEYARLKKAAVEQADGDGAEYRRLKNPFFQEVLNKTKKV